MSKLQFKDLLLIYRAATFEQNGELAQLEIVNQLLLDTLRLSISDENLDDSGIRIESGDPDSFKIGQRVTLNITAPRSGLGKIAKDIEHLVQIENACLVEPNRYFIINEKFAKDDIQVPDSVQRYRKIISFVDLLKQCADYVDQTASELVFLKEGKFIIPVKFAWSKIEKIDLNVVDKLLGFFHEDTHKEQKLSILTNTILSLVESSAVGGRFNVLLEEIRDMLNKFSEGYKIFIADFSYDKVRNEFETFRIEYAGKIHKIFSDIQNQLLTIPVATVIVATSMKAVTTESISLANNAVLLGAWVFAILFVLLCINQWKTLTALSKEIERQKKVMADDYPTISATFDDVFEWLGKRVKMQYNFLIIVIVVLIVGLGSAHYFYFRMIDAGRAEQLEAAVRASNSRDQTSKGEFKYLNN